MSGRAIAVGNFDGVHRGHRLVLDELVRLAFDRKRKEELKTFSFDNNIFAMGGAIGAKGSKGTKF